MKREPRMRRSAKTRRISPAQVRAAWTLYGHGLSINDIARQSWQNLGYKSARTCEEAIRTSFTRLGYETRSRGQARRLSWALDGCTGCGVPKDERTFGCQTCTSRHYQREQRGEGDFVPYEPRCCGCGCDPDVKTYACRQCIDRHSKRRKDRRLRQNELAAQPAPPSSSACLEPRPGGAAPSSERKVAA